MTGPLGPMDDDGVVDLLRAAGRGGPDASAADVSRAMAAGAKIRRRRQAMQAVGSSLAIVAVLGVGITAVSALDDDDRGTAVTTSPDQVATNSPAIAKTAAAAREANNALLLDTLGEDYRINTREEGPGVTLRENTATAKRLPDGYYVTASVWVGGPGDGFIGLEELCGELVEEGLRRSACVPVKTSSGQTVQLQTRQSVLKEGTVGGAYNTLLALFERSDGTVSEVRMQAADESTEASAARQQLAQRWLDEYRETFAALAADPRIQSGPREGTAGTNKAQSAADYLAEDMGEGWFRQNARVVLDSASDLASRLPDGEYEARAEAGIIDQAAFDQVCQERPGLGACPKRELPDGRTLHSRSWADRDIDGNMRGESVLYRAIGDGRYLLVAVSVSGEQISEANRDAHVAALTQWYGSVQEGLRKASTDDRLTSLVVQLDDEYSTAEPNTISRCDSVPAPPPGEYDSGYDPTTGKVTLTFSYAGNVNYSYTVDPRNDPTCDANKDLKPFIDHVTDSHEADQ